MKRIFLFFLTASEIAQVESSTSGFVCFFGLKTTLPFRSSFFSGSSPKEASLEESLSEVGASTNDAACTQSSRIWSSAPLKRTGACFSIQ